MQQQREEKKSDEAERFLRLCLLFRYYARREEKGGENSLIINLLDNLSTIGFEKRHSPCIKQLYYSRLKIVAFSSLFYVCILVVL